MTDRSPSSRPGTAASATAALSLTPDITEDERALGRALADLMDRLTALLNASGNSGDEYSVRFVDGAPQVVLDAMKAPDTGHAAAATARIVALATAGMEDIRARWGSGFMSEDRFAGLYPCPGSDGIFSCDIGLFGDRFEIPGADLAGAIACAVALHRAPLAPPVAEDDDHTLPAWTVTWARRVGDRYSQRITVRASTAIHAVRLALWEETVQNALSGAGAVGVLAVTREVDFCEDALRGFEGSTTPLDLFMAPLIAQGDRA